MAASCFQTAYRTTSKGIVAAGFAVEVYNVLGAGDAFMGGFLRGWLRDAPIEECSASATPVERSWSHGMAVHLRCRLWPELELFFAARERKFACVRIRGSSMYLGYHSPRL